MSENCDCKNREHDVCTNCSDNVLEELDQNIINGTAGKILVDLQIELKTYLISIIYNPEFIKKTQDEILALRQFREIQYDA
jgi:DNA-binding protein YbaB